MPHPNRGPRNPRSSFKTNNSGVSESTATMCCCPFTFRVILSIEWGGTLASNSTVRVTVWVGMNILDESSRTKVTRDPKGRVPTSWLGGIDEAEIPRSPFEPSFAADAIACPKQAAAEIRDVHTNRSLASASQVLQNGLSRVTTGRP